MSGLVVRPATKADVPALGRLAGQLVRFHHGLDPNRFMDIPNPEEGYGRWLGREAENPDALVLVAEQDGAVIGYAYARLEGRDYNALLEAHAKLHDVLVDPPARRTGAGEALVREVARIMKERGAPRLLLYTATQNDVAQRLFARVGFEPTMIEMTLEL